MKIIHLIDQFDYCDGCARHVFLLAVQQKKKGHEVLLVAGKGDALGLLEREKIEYRVVPSIHHADRSVIGFVSGAMTLRRIIRSTSPDIIHAHHFYAAHQARLASSRGRLVFTVHANLPKIGWLSKYPGDALIAVSESTKTWITEQYPALSGKISVVPNSSAFLGLDQEIKGMPLYQKLLERAKRNFIVMYSGRLVKVKGVQNVLEAVARLQREFPITCIIAGEGAHEKELRERASALSIDAMFFGRISDIKPLLEIAHVVVLPSLSSEGLPMTLLEAGLASRAVVASNLDGIPELVRDGVSGLLVAPGDVPQLAHALQRLHDEPALRAAMGAALRKKVEAYPVSAMADGVDKVYEMLISKHS